MNVIKTTLAALMVASMAPAALAQDSEIASEDAALQALDDALPGELLHNPLTNKWESGGNDMRTKIVDAEPLLTKRAFQAKIKKKQNKKWDSYMRLENFGEVKEGQTVQIIYYVRTVKPPKNAETADVGIFLGRNVAPFDMIAGGDIQPPTEWEMRSLKGTAGKDFDAGRLKLEIQLGAAPQTVEIGPAYVSVLN